ncbi:MAG: rod shape-determining protein MreD [Burkholderiaceae bacterium]|nr:MAG: rod shape-determining protein MreD [Burkholderiaceae bacterium]
MKWAWGRKKFSLGSRAPGLLAEFIGKTPTSVRDPQPILLPVHPGFIAFSLIAGFIFNLMPWGQSLWMPDFLAMVLVFWNIHQPRKVGIGLAWLFGLLMDVHDAGVLGEHGLAYTLLSYSAIMIHRRVLWFPLATQSLYILPLFLLAQTAIYLVRLATGEMHTSLLFFMQSLITSLLWAPTSLLLLAPQHRAVNKDENRPI